MQKDLPLFTGTPSRSLFPRGFLWDDGFILQIICVWEPLLCIESLDTWINTLDERGWIPREQIRGAEAENFADKNFLK